MTMIASHIIFGCYGFWLPNDPRGAWSEYIRNRKIFEFGGANMVTTRYSVAHVEHDAKNRIAAKQGLRYPPVIFNREQIHTVADGFAAAVAESNYRIYACAIMPDHVHMIAGNHDNTPQRIMAQLKARATQELLKMNLHPFQNFAAKQSPWARNGWAVYIENETQLRVAIEYVNLNPVKVGLSEQAWGFVSKET